jgi:hypothetical protein
MSDSKKKILEMLAKGKISADDAYRLLGVLEEGEGSEGEPAKAEPVVAGKGKYLRVNVVPDPDSPGGGHADRVNVRVPLSLVRAGIKLTSLIPSEARDKVNDSLKEKGINFDVNSIKAEDLEELIQALGDLEVDVVSGTGEKIKVFVE